MSSSAAPRTVAMNSPLDKFLNLLIPKVTAGIPTGLVDSQDTQIELTKAWIVVKEIEFKSEELAAQESEEEANEEIKFRGPYFVNLLSAEAQVLDTQQVPAKVYRRIEMKLEAAENETSANWPSAAPTELANNSIYLAGTFGSGATAFSFSSHDGTEFKISGAGGVAPEEGQNILLSIRFADIIRKINFNDLVGAADKNISDSNRVSSTNPCPLIDESSNDLYTCFRKGLESEADFGKDSDGSGELEDDEDHAED